MRYCYDLREVPEELMQQVGGKAMSLAKMIQNLKVTIPNGIAIAASAFEIGAIKEEAKQELESIVSGLDGRYTYAVRSSALNEDGQQASFAGQYDTITDVAKEQVMDAVKSVIESAQNARVQNYTDSFRENNLGISVVIQRFVKPEFAGVIFTSDVITGRDDFLVGNYVHGEGEKLVSGVENASEFRIGTIKYEYIGNAEMKLYAKKLYRFCMQIKNFYQAPMDIEWAVSGGQVYILQARPITTLKRITMDSYEVNSTLSGCKLLTKTNVGEIFMKPISPMTFSVLDKINDFLGLPDWLSNVCGQPYMNISILCSIMVSFGMSKEKALSKITELVGSVPEGLDIPISPFNKRAWFSKLKVLIFPKGKIKMSRAEKHDTVERLPEICRELIAEIHAIPDNEKLLAYWDTVMMPRVKECFAAILGECGTSILALFGTKEKLGKIAGEDLANRLCSGCVGILDSMKPLLLLEDIIAGELTEEEYLNICGHRCTNEMELMEPRPYEMPEIMQQLLEEHKKSGMNLRKMQETVKQDYDAALAEFETKYPGKRAWLHKKIDAFAKANRFREEIRSKGVWIFCVFREYLLQAGRINSLGDDVFMLTFDEVFALLRGDNNSLVHIEARKQTFERYNQYPPFPNLVMGRFVPEEWEKDVNKRRDFYCSSVETTDGTKQGNNVVKGFPGAAGKVTGMVRVILDSSEIHLVEQGDILVTTATNIGWTLVFPKVSAIVTDIGAPLSHAAIVAREFGIPAIVGCGNATSVLKTGDKVMVDGEKGTVTYIEE